MFKKIIILSSKAKKRLNLFLDLNLIRTSGFFNKDWYLEHNPDVAQSNVEPVFHYLQYGGFEGRDPGPDFCSSWYLDTYADVRENGINPLVHYLRYGVKEKRKTHIPKNILEDSVQKSSIKEERKNDFSLSTLSKEKGKVFCIGLNKTGTTSIESVLKDMGYKVGVQSEAELFMDDWAIRDFRRIIEYCQSADAFQDVPFSLDFTYQILDHAFPNSKFILTVRNNADEWYESLVRFHAKLIGIQGTPTADDLKNFSYRNPGWLWRTHQQIYGIDESTLYNEKIYKGYYTNYNDRVLDYFRFRPKDLLVLNLSEQPSMQSLCKFLGIKYESQTMPHLNKSRN